MYVRTPLLINQTLVLHCKDHIRFQHNRHCNQYSKTLLFYLNINKHKKIKAWINYIHDYSQLNLIVLEIIFDNLVWKFCICMQYIFQTKASLIYNNYFFSGFWKIKKEFLFFARDLNQSPVNSGFAIVYYAETPTHKHLPT